MTFDLSREVTAGYSAVPEKQAGARGGWERWNSGLHSQSWQETRHTAERRLSALPQTPVFVPHRVPSPTLQPPRGLDSHSFSLKLLQKVCDWNRSGGGAWVCFAVGSSSLCYLCTGLDHNHRVKKRMWWFATVSFSQYWPRRLSLTPLWGLLVVLNVLEVTYHMYVNLETSRGS